MGSIISRPRAAEMSPMSMTERHPYWPSKIGCGCLGGRVVAGDEHVVLATAHCLRVDLDVGGHGAQRLDDGRAGHRALDLLAERVGVADEQLQVTGGEVQRVGDVQQRLAGERLGQAGEHIDHHAAVERHDDQLRARRLGQRGELESRCRVQPLGESSGAVGAGTGAGLAHIIRAQQHIVAQRAEPPGMGPTDHAGSEDADPHGVPVPLLLTMVIALSPRGDG